MECNIEDIPQSVKTIKEVVYLGVMYSADGRMEGELVRRLELQRVHAVGAMLRSKKAKVHGSVPCNSNVNDDLR